MRRVMTALAENDGNGSERHRQRRHAADEPQVTATDAPPEALTLCGHD
jgi:hypothetical protein